MDMVGVLSVHEITIGFDLLLGRLIGLWSSTRFRGPTDAISHTQWLLYLGLSQSRARPSKLGTREANRQRLIRVLKTTKSCVLQALQEQHLKDLQMQMLQEAGRHNHASLAGPLSQLQNQEAVGCLTTSLRHRKP